MSDTSSNTIERLRPKLLALARQMLGCWPDAEDAVQDAYLRYQQHAAGIAAPDAWLVRTTTRLCLDRVRQLRRETGTEPTPDSPAAIAPDPLELADSLVLAFRVLLGTLSPAEQAAFVLREAFDYDFAEIGDLLGKSPANARQIAHRARRRLADPDRSATDLVETETFADGFLAACRTGDLGAIERLLLSGPAAPTCRADAIFLLAA